MIKKWYGKSPFRLIAVLLVFPILMTSVNACSTANAHDLEREFHSFELDDVESVSVDVEIESGALEISGGADELMTAIFTYDPKETKPEIDYEKTDASADITVTQTGRGIFPVTGVTSDIALHFNNDVTCCLNVDLGKGDGYLKLGGFCPSRTEINLNSGHLTLDLTGDWKCNLNTTIEGGHGKIHILLPADVATAINFGGSIGEVWADGMREDGNLFVNDAYDFGSSETSLFIQINGQYGQTHLEVVD
jgi:hypothetical protein